MVQGQDHRFLRARQGIGQPVEAALIDAAASSRQIAVQPDQQSIAYRFDKAKMILREGRPIRKDRPKRLRPVVVARERQQPHWRFVEQRQRMGIIPRTAINYVTGQDDGGGPNIHRRDHCKSLSHGLYWVVAGIGSIGAQMWVGYLGDQGHSRLPLRPIRLSTISGSAVVIRIVTKAIAIPRPTDPCSNCRQI